MKDNKENLEEIAQEQVKRSGLKGLSFRTLAEEAGIKSSSVHYHFPQKTDLADALIERYTKAFMEELYKIAAMDSWNLRKKLTEFIKIFDDVAEDDAVCLCVMFASEHLNLSVQNRNQLNDFFRGTEKWLSNLFNNHKDELNTSLQSIQLARSIVCGLEGALLIDRVAGNNKCLVAVNTVALSYVK